MTNASITIVLITIAFFVVSLPFYMFIGVGSVQYYANQVNASEEAIESFLKELRFPFTIYSMGDGAVRSIREMALKKKGRSLCILSGILPLILSLFVLSESYLRKTDNFELIFGAAGFLVLFAPIIRMWRFGHRLITLR